ncbi:MAG: NAD(P)H-dependent glycerol-3-phosphate dehydrogenase [candidate division WOR-3 bacterium]
MNIAFIGAGRWALALAAHFSRHGHKTSLYEPSASLLDRLLATRTHPDLPDGWTLPSELLVAADAAQVVSGAEILLFATPAAELTRAATDIAPLLPKTLKTVVSVTKGLDPQTLRRISVRLHELMPRLPIVVLAGPAIPYDFAAGDPTSLVAASEDADSARIVRTVFTSGHLRIYSHNDVAGVELAAAFKNVIALAAGIATAIGLRTNARAALLTRGLAEIIRLGLALNCNPLTFAGLAGMGDLIVTASSGHSRNYQLGLSVGSGEPADKALARLNGVAEGYSTARTGLELGRRLSVELPITEQVYRILYEGAKPSEALRELLRRTPKKELWS